MNPVAIVGGGISGLSTAWYLSRQGVPAVLFESEPRTGGLIHTELVQDCQIEWGPDSFITTKTAARDLIEELGLSDDLISTAPHRKTYLWNGEKLVPIPEGLQLVAPSKLGPIFSTPLLTWGTKVRMALEMLRKPHILPLPDRSVSAFINDHYGREAVEIIAEPLMAGVYGGAPELLSAASVLPKLVEYECRYGSLTRGARENRGPDRKSGLFQTLKSGMGHLTQTLSAKLAQKVPVIHEAVTAIELAKTRGEGYFVRSQGTPPLEASSVVLACRTWQAAPLVESFAPTLARDLAAIPYSSAITLALGYRRRELDHPLDGFGFLVPRKYRRHVLACTWVGAKWPHKVPEGRAVLRCFLSGSEEYVRETPEEDLIRSCRNDLHALMGVKTEPVFTRINRWPRSMPQYEVGHKALVESIFSQLSAHPGLYLAGNAYDGVGIPDSIRWAKTAAEQAAAHHQSIVGSG